MVVTSSPEVRGVHLVGSVPLSNAAEVFKFVSNTLRHHAKRVPDGETGARINWTQWQLEVFDQVEALESEIVDSGYIKRSKFRLKPDKTAQDVIFPPLG